MKALRVPLLSAALVLLAVDCPGLLVISKQPSPLTNSVSLGANLTNSITATTTNPPLAYLWQLNNMPLSGATSASLVLTNIQTNNAGKYVAIITDGDGSIPSSSWVIDVDPTFTKITSDPVVGAYGGQGEGGAAWGDYNNDGYPDLFVSVIQGTNLLFANNGNGTFTKVTTGALVTGSFVSAGSAWGDYDNDGFLDLFVSVNGSPPNNDLLFNNNGNGTFTRPFSGSIATSGGKGNGCAWGDYDNDGYLDLYVCNSDQNNFLYHNNGNGTFTRITTGPPVTNTGNSQGCAWGDYDNDGYLDLFVTRSGGNNQLYHNNRNGTFTLVTNGPVVADSSGGPCAWGDYDNDGYLDRFATRAPTSLLYHNNGDGTFTKITNGPVVTDITGYNGGCAWVDYDNDGYQDLFISVIGNQNLFYHNNGDGTFAKVTTGSVVTDGNAIGCAWGDYDNNGFPDLFATGAGVPGHLYRNNGNANNWLTIQCLGRISNRSAIGAKIRVQATIHGQQTWQLREISGGGGLGSQNDLRAQFGLGDATNADVIRIEWPSGIVQQFANVAPRQFLTVKEPPKLVADFQPQSGELHVVLTGGKNLVYSLESSADLASWTPVALLTNISGTVIWTNQNSGRGQDAFFRARE